MYTLNLEADRTVTGNLDGEVSGTWHLEPVKENSGYRSIDMKVQYTKDGQSRIFTSSIQLGTTDKDLEACLENLRFTMWQNNYATVMFRKTSPSEKEQIETALEEGQQKLIGTWSSEKLQITSQDSGAQTEKETTEYSFTFDKDGTFTVLFDKEYRGIWMLDSVEIQNGEMRYDYAIQFDGAERASEVSIIGPGRIYFSASDETYSCYGWFLQTSDGIENHGELAPELIVGSWTSVRAQYYSEASQTYEDAQNFSGRLTVFEDGTFTAEFGREVKGTWRFSEYDYSSGYCYAFMEDGAQGSMIYHIQNGDSLDAFYEIDGTFYTMTMSKEE